MYLTNKYTRWYYSIIQQSKTRSLSGYTEKHHIIPKSLGGDNTKNNLAILTPREHFICHLLLTKMTEGINKQKMIFGLWRMSVPTKDRHRITSTQYEKIRNEFCRVNSDRHKGKINSKESLDKRKSTMLERYGTMITFTKHNNIAKKKISGEGRRSNIPPKAASVFCQHRRWRESFRSACDRIQISTLYCTTHSRKQNSSSGGLSPG